MITTTTITTIVTQINAVSTLMWFVALNGFLMNMRDSFIVSFE
jgi:hypothetical protein